MFKKVHYITAGAGAGKTTRLVNIITGLVDDETAPADPERMILTTYTDAAATEFREKSKAALPPEKAVRMNAAKIGTVHSIASAYINRYWYLLGVSPSVKPMNETMSAILMNRSLEDVVTGEEAAVFNRYTETFGISKPEGGYYYDFWKDGLKRLFEKMRGYGFGKERIPEFRDNTLKLLREAFDMKRNQALFAEVKPVLDHYLSYEAVVNHHATDAGKKQFGENCARIREILNMDPEKADVKMLDDIKSAKWGKPACINKKGPLKDQYDPELKDIQQQLKSSIDDLASLLVPVESSLIITVTEQMFGIVGKWMDRYSKIKDENGVIDYADMEEKFHLLLQKDEVIEDIEKSVDYLFVDEFQDSSPIQAKIFDILSNHIRQSWFVGDRKQAIYGFAGSDAGLVGELAQVFPAAVKDPSSPTGFEKDGSGNSSQILTTSYRSVPVLVETANKIFTEAFGVLEPDCPLDQIPADQVKLDPEEGKTDPAWESLYHVVAEGGNAAAKADALASVLCRMADDDRFRKAGYSPSDIAILARSKAAVKAIASALKRKGIRTAAIDPDSFLDTPEVSLIVAVLKLSAGVDTAKSRAEIRKILSDEDLAKLTDRIKDDENKLDGFHGLDAFVKSMRTLSVSDRIDEIVTRFDMHGVCGFWDSPISRRSNINLLRQAAKEYLDQSMLLCSAADVRGFLSYLKAFEPDPKFDNTAEGVKVLTYHKAKGLDWRIVILCGLDKKKEAKDVSGITVIGKRSSPDSLLAIPSLPDKEWVEGCILANPETEKLLRERRAAQRGEERRLLYVGFTRAKDIVITVAESASPEVIDYLCPTVKNRTASPDAGHVDIWGVGQLSAFCTVTDDPTATAAPGEAPLRYKEAGFYLPEKKDGEPDPKYLSPSKYKYKNIQAVPSVTSVKDFNARTDISHKDLSDNEFGDCLHHLFAVCEPGKHTENLAAAERTLKAFGIVDTDAPAKAVDAIEGFFEWLASKYGPAVRLDREVPFQYEDDKGHVFSGNMDLVWRSAADTVLVDYKTFPGSKAELFNPDSDHWAGKYATQLDIYSRALTLNDGHEPSDQLLYYPVEGLVVSVK